MRVVPVEKRAHDLAMLKLQLDGQNKNVSLNELTDLYMKLYIQLHKELREAITEVEYKRDNN